MKTINLADGSQVLVDDEDYDLISELKWHLVADFAYNSKLGVFMHQFIMDNMPLSAFTDDLVENIPVEKLAIMHINGDRLDNRRCNLKIVPRACIARRSRIRKGHKSSRYKGVTWDKDGNRWFARISYNGTTYNLGSFKKEKDAARAYDQAAKKYFGKCAFLNLPSDNKVGDTQEK